MFVKSIVALTFATTLAIGAATCQESQAKVGLDGYCPVCIVKAKKWMKGNKEFASKFDGKIYYFPGPKEKELFDAAPEKFVPALGGDCVVCKAKAGKRVAGSVKFASRFKDRVFLFPSDKEREMFQKDPAAFADVDIAIKGNCIVCKKMAGKAVKGREKFTAVYKGMRYLFPSDRERQAFIKSPMDFVTTDTHSTENTSFTFVSGRAGCAACEHGIRPIKNSKELGLAINASDGNIYVIEDAHKKWPKIYKDRFDSIAISAKGKVIKTAGRVSWIEASDVKRSK